MLRYTALALMGLALGGCVADVGLNEARAPRDRVESLWDFAPHDAAFGVVAHPTALTRAIALDASLKEHPAARPPKRGEDADDRKLPPLETAKDWERAGLDPSLDAAAFSWQDEGRGVLVVVPLADRALFRRAFQAHPLERDPGADAAAAGRSGGGKRDIDELANGYKCARIVDRLLCAKSLGDIDAAAAAHSSPVAFGGEHLDPDDTGDIEAYATPNAPNIRDMAEAGKNYGSVKGVAAAFRLRDDGASLRVHVVGEMVSSLARSLSGAPPSTRRPTTAAGSATVVRIHIDPKAAAEASKEADPETKSEMITQLTGDMEVTTEGRGLAGMYAELDLVDAARVEAYVKKECAATGGSMITKGLKKITVVAHGCTAVFDPVLPLSMDPIPLSANVEGGKLVIVVGDAKPPTPEARTTAGVVERSDAAFALTDTEAIVAFTQAPWIGPDVGAGAAFRRITRLISEESAQRADEFNDLVSHVAQAMLAGRVAENGIILTAAFVTFAHDPPEVQAAYDAALVARGAGDLTTYRARLDDIERRFPGSLAAKRAEKLRIGAPYFGAGLFALAAVSSKVSK